jgi:large subunit GTPase 1
MCVLYNALWLHVCAHVSTRAQTLMLSDDLMLCDCPGLVMPSLASTQVRVAVTSTLTLRRQAQMYLDGLLPIDRMRMYAPPAALLCKRIGR